MNKNDCIIRLENENNYKAVETLTREAFWNVYVPGCDEHYLVHKMRSHRDFIKELAFVMEYHGKIIGNVMYTKSKLTDEDGNEMVSLTFGPVSIAPKYQRLGLSSLLLEHSFVKAKAMGYDVIVIFGSPCNYISRGFKSCKKYNICLKDGSFPASMLVKELNHGSLDGRKYFFTESSLDELLNDKSDFERFDMQFEHKEKAWRHSQEEFYIYSHSYIL